MLGRLEMSIDECLERYEKIGKDVFGKRQIGGGLGRLVKGMTNQAFFDIGKLQSAIKNVLEKKSLPLDTSFCGDNSHPAKV